MSKIIIRGGKRLHGCVDIAGAKNAVLPIMAASLLNKADGRYFKVLRLYSKKKRQ